MITQTQKQRLPKAFSLNKSKINQSVNNSYMSSMSTNKKSKISLQKKLGAVKENDEELYAITIDPKVLEPYDPIPGRVPRKVAIERKKKEYQSFNIEDLII